MALSIQPVAFLRNVAFAVDRASPGDKRMLGYAAISNGIGNSYEIRLQKDGVTQATYTMTGALPYSLSTGLAPTVAMISSIVQTGAIDLSSGTWTVQIASLVNIGWSITGTLSTSGADFTLSGTLPLPAPSPSTGTGPTGQNEALWTRTFTEEFTGASLDSSKWIDEIWYGDDFNDGTVTNYDVNNSGNSCLRIWPEINSSSQWFNRTINTDGKFSQQYGYFEARMKLPVGKGVWPAFWLFGHPGALRPEIDIMEAYNGGSAGGWSTDAYQPNNYGASMHLPGILSSYGPFKLSETLGTVRLDTDFHVYGCEWDATTIKFYFDGQLLRSQAYALPYSLFILLDIWYGSAAGTPNTTDTPRGSSNSMMIDYVRAWSRV